MQCSCNTEKNGDHALDAQGGHGVFVPTIQISVRCTLYAGYFLFAVISDLMRSLSELSLMNPSASF
jgi:hypothetical protein